MSAVERGTDALMRQIATIGPHTKAWGELVIATRGVQGVRVLVGLKSLAGKHAYSELEEACETAVSYGACRLKSIRNLLKRKPTGKATATRISRKASHHPDRYRTIPSNHSIPLEKIVLLTNERNRNERNFKRTAQTTSTQRSV